MPKGFTEISVPGYEVVLRSTEVPGVVVAVHSTRLGPALGGCRVWSYGRPEDALDDALRLARGMSYKSSLAGLNLGGGKTVVDLPDERGRLLAFGVLADMLNHLRGAYVTAEDVGTSVADMEVLRRLTPHVASLGGSGDPSPWTALGVVEAMRATAAAIGRDGLDGMRIAVQGLGKVGMDLCQRLRGEGAALVVGDIDDRKVRHAVEALGAEAVAADAVHAVECDIYAPCALGGALGAGTAPDLRCRAVCGSANNQLESDDVGDALFARGILYGPDYLVNAGGVVNVAAEVGRPYDAREAERMVRRIGDRTREVYARSRQEKVSPHRIADAMAAERLED